MVVVTDTKPANEAFHASPPALRRTRKWCRNGSCANFYGVDLLWHLDATWRVVSVRVLYLRGVALVSNERFLCALSHYRRSTASCDENAPQMLRMSSYTHCRTQPAEACALPRGRERWNNQTFERFWGHSLAQLHVCVRTKGNTWQRRSGGAVGAAFGVGRPSRCFSQLYSRRPALSARVCSSTFS